MSTFHEWMNHFIKHVKCSMEAPIILLLDNHESHISVEVLDTAKNNGITMITLPAHCSHKLQPLDRSVFGPFKRYYNASCDNWMLSNPRPMTIFDIAGIARPAYDRAFKKENIESGFAVCGIEPFNRDLQRTVASWVSHKMQAKAMCAPLNFVIYVFSSNWHFFALRSCGFELQTKMINDIMTCMFTLHYMATHSVSGGIADKEQITPAIVILIIRRFYNIFSASVNLNQSFVCKL